MHYIAVGTFNTPSLYTIAFDEHASSLEIVHKSDAIGSHSWLSLNADKSRLYATCWTEPPGLAAYSVSPASDSDTVPIISLLNSVPTAARSGYCCNSPSTVYTAGGPSGEVFRIDPSTGAFQVSPEDGAPALLQTLDFVGSTGKQIDGGKILDFGGLRHGAHSADLSPDGKTLYVADIGRNCIFVYGVKEDGTLALTDKKIASRSNDGPRHAWPHPGGRYVYVLQEHTSMVDAYELDCEKKLTLRQSVRIIPTHLSENLFWADEVRLSPSGLYLYASTRGLESSQKGFVSVFPLSPDGSFQSLSPLAMWATPTSGGWANAIEPAPRGNLGRAGDGKGGKDYIALTDSEEGLVMMLSWDGKEVREVARTRLDDGAGAATAVWLTA